MEDFQELPLELNYGRQGLQKHCKAIQMISYDLINIDGNNAPSHYKRYTIQVRKIAL